MLPDENCPEAEAKDPNFVAGLVPVHCQHWYDCEPCCWCGDDTIDPHCDCDRCTALRQP